MYIIPPMVVNDTVLVSSNVTEDDAPVYDAATTYAEGDTVIFEHSVYESLVDGNVGQNPPTVSTSWLRLGATNLYKAFDQHLTDRVVNAGSITYTIAHNGEFVSALAVFGLAGSTLEVETVDPDAGVVFSETYTLLDETGVVDWSTYFFSPIGVQRQEVIEIEIPPYLNAETTITVTGISGSAELGQIVIGRLLDIGVATYGVGLSLKDYSRKERDAFGNAIIVERAFAQNVDYPVVFPTNATRRLQNTLAAYRAKPVVWIGDTDESLGTIVYGYFNRFDILLPSPTISEATIEVEGLT